MFNDWEEIQGAAYTEWRRPGSCIRIVPLNSLFRVLSSLQMPGMFELPAVSESQTAPLFAMDFTTLAAATGFADA